MARVVTTCIPYAKHGQTSNTGTKPHVPFKMHFTDHALLVHSHARWLVLDLLGDHLLANMAWTLAVRN